MGRWYVNQKNQVVGNIWHVYHKEPNVTILAVIEASVLECHTRYPAKEEVRYDPLGPGGPSDTRPPIPNSLNLDTPTI